MRQAIDLVGGFYTDDSLPWSCQDTVNYIPVAAESGGTRTVSKLVDAPGLRPHVWIGNQASGVSSAPIRGLHDVEGQLFAVCGRTLYQISNAGVAIPRGTIPGVGRVSMAHNQRSTGNELIVVNGSAGYVWNTASQTFSVVTDAGYPGASVVDFIDGYLMQVEPFGRFLFHSDLADALEYNTLDRFEAETAPDRTLGMIVNHQEVWAFGERTIDVFGNAGTAQGTFQNKGVSISRGCAAKWTPAVIDNGVAWLGDDLKVYHANGYSPVRISTRAVEVALSECSRTDLRNAFSFVWEDLSHAVYYLTVPNGPTFGYDFSTGLWHRRSSWHPERDLSGRWRINDLVRHNGQWIGGDFQTGKMYVLDWDYMMEGCEPLVRERVTPVAHNDGLGFVIDSAEVFFDTADAVTECVEWPTQPHGPTLTGAAPDGAVGIEYDGYTYTTTVGDAPIVSRRIVSGAFPEGVEFNLATLTLGTQAPTKLETANVTLEVTDANGLTATLSDSIVIGAVWFAIAGTPTLGAPAVYGRSIGGVDWTGPLRDVSGSVGSYRYIMTGAGKVLFYDTERSSISSTYGVTWANGTAGLAIYKGVYHDGTFYAGSASDGMWKTDNGTAWTKINTYNSAQGMAVKDGRIVVTGGDFSQYTDDAFATMTPVSVGFVPTVAAFPVDASEDEFIAGSGSTVDGGLKIIRSKDGESWTPVSHSVSDSGDYASCIRHGDGFWVVGTGYGRILVKGPRDSSFRTVAHANAPGYAWIDIEFSGGRFVIVGALGAMATATVQDIDTWTALPNNFENYGISGVGAAVGGGV